MPRDVTRRHVGQSRHALRVVQAAARPPASLRRRAARKVLLLVHDARPGPDVCLSRHRAVRAWAGPDSRACDLAGRPMEAQRFLCLLRLFGAEMNLRLMTIVALLFAALALAAAATDQSTPRPQGRGSAATERCAADMRGPTRKWAMKISRLIAVSTAAGLPAGGLFGV